MSDPFAAAIDALFSGPGSAAAAYQPIGEAGGAAFPIRVIRSRPDLSTGFGEGRIVQASNSFEIRASDVARPAADDLVAIGGTVTDGAIEGGELFALVGEPMIDVEGLTWLIGAERLAE